MYPQSELDNYKLQVELLQEKLKRSEDNRQQLAHQLDHIMYKRNELDKSARQKTRQKYQEFLDEQRKRNERNKMLMQMLERIDEQTAAMSARSERLKMMKLQYEMYFAKLVQAQTMRCIQAPPTVNAAAAAAAIPVLLPTTTTAAPGQPQKSTETQQQQQPVPPPTATSAPPTQQPQQQQQQQQQWTLAMATPTPAGMLLSTGGGTPTALSAYHMQPSALPTSMLSAYDAAAAAAAYLHYPPPPPLGAYLPHSPRLMAAHAAAAAAAAAAVGNVPSNFLDYHNFSNNNSNITTTDNMYHYINNNNNMPTLRDLDKMNDVTSATPTNQPAPATQTPTSKSTKVKTIDGRHMTELSSAVELEPAHWRLKTEAAQQDDDGDGDDGNSGGDSAGTGAGGENEQLPWQLSPMSPVISTPTTTTPSTTTTTPTSSSSSMAFDKLPKSLLTRTKANIARIDAALGGGGGTSAPNTTTAMSMAMPPSPLSDRRSDMAAALAAAMKPQIEFSASDFATLPLSHPTTTTGNTNNNTNNNTITGNPNNNNIGHMNGVNDSNAYIAANNSHVAAAASATASRQKIDAPLPPSATAPPHMMANGGVMAATDDYGAATSVAAVDDWLGDIAPPQPTAAMKPPRESIETIENAIYGELMQPPTAAVEHAANLRSVTQGVLDDFLAQQQQRELPGEQPPAGTTNAPMDGVGIAGGGVGDGADYAATYASVGDSNGSGGVGGTGGIGVGVTGGEDTTISSMSYGMEPEPNSEPTYATIDDVNQINSNTNNNNNNAMPETYQSGELEATTATADATGLAYGAQQPAASDADGTNVTSGEQQQQQEYDYSNYSAADYDPNAYPGYTYDEATGQYIPDPEATDQQQQQQEQQQQQQQQMYGNDEAYAAQMQAYEQQQQQQQQQYNEGNYDYGNYEQPSATATEDVTAAAAEPVASAGDGIDGTLNYDETTAADVPAEAPAATTAAKKTPTSILSTAAATSGDAKKKKRVNFVDSSETDESVKQATAAASAAVAGGSESDFDFSSNSEQQLQPQQQPQQ